jgi:AmmeMemoRadiSam system protein A
VLTDTHRKQLLRIAREAIEIVHAGRSPRWNAADFDEALHRLAGAFVTLKTKEGELRGCIGSILAVDPLYQAVTSSAISAAFRDPRFLPVQPDELPHLGIEISVMGPLEPVRSPDEIVVGRDGLVVRRGRYAGLLLPQVAIEYGWERETFLAQTCVKAGLPPAAWRSQDTQIERFAAEVFGE